MERKFIKESIRLDLDNNMLLNIFGLVNVAAVRARVGGCESYSDKELEAIIKELFDDEVIGGVQFKVKKSK